MSQKAFAASTEIFLPPSRTCSISPYGRSTERRAMLPLRRAVWLSLMLYATWLGTQATTDDNQHRPTTFIFNEFNTTSLNLLGDASIQYSTVIRLTNASYFRVGRALYSMPVRIKSNGSALSFSTTFVFSIVPAPSNAGGHGLAFFMPPRESLAGVTAAAYLGLLSPTSNGLNDTHLFAVEFDTVKDDVFQDIDDNHVGIDLNDVQSFGAEPAGYWTNDGRFQGLSLKSKRNIQAWIDYDHLQNQLNVTIALAGALKPMRPLISLKNIDLSDILQEQMYVGFSAATGHFLVEEHYILAWSFSTNGTAPALNLSHLHDFGSQKSKHVSPGIIAGVVVGSLLLLLLLVSILCAALCSNRIRGPETIEHWELEYWPHRFSYSELSIATEGFREERLLGSGGFGRVYKGILPGSGIEVAVKCITNEVTQGLKEFIAEVSSIGRLQHRNLVRIQGWGRKNGHLFIVYDYMANGSLDKLIFGQPNAALRWSQRYGILKGVAAGLLYLHEEWEKRVVHRDIKSSNVLLDSELNPRLSDFGLARLYDHNKNPLTTRVVGTVGYIAPEFIRTGKATPSTDVFSFGILSLEVACGRRPVDTSNNGEQVDLLEWVRELHAKKMVLAAADPKLCGEYDAEEMERVLQLGLLCCHPRPEGRPTIRHALQILEGPKLRFHELEIFSRDL